MNRKRIKHQASVLPTTKQMLSKAGSDTDRVSIWSVGDTIDTAELGVVVIKGTDELRMFRDWAERNGLITPGKPVENFP